MSDTNAPSPLRPARLTRKPAARRGGGITLALPVLALMALVLVRPAHAYIDPGTGSYLLQTLLGLLFGLLYAMKVYWQQVKAIAHRIFSRKTRDPNPET